MIAIRFEPKEDITAYELALIYGHVHNGPLAGGPLVQRDIHIDEDRWAELDPRIQRHFRLVGRLDAA